MLMSQPGTCKCAEPCRDYARPRPLAALSPRPRALAGAFVGLCPFFFFNGLQTSARLFARFKNGESLARSHNRQSKRSVTSAREGL